MNETIRRAAKLYYNDVTDADLDAIEKGGDFLEKRIGEILKYIEGLPSERLAAAVFASCISGLFQNFAPEKEKEYLKEYIKRLDIKETDVNAFSELAKRLEMEKA